MDVPFFLYCVPSLLVSFSVGTPNRTSDGSSSSALFQHGKYRAGNRDGTRRRAGFVAGPTVGYEAGNTHIKTVSTHHLPEILLHNQHRSTSRQETCMYNTKAIT